MRASTPLYTHRRNALALTQFLGSKVESSPIAHLLELLIVLLILLGLSVVTWKWLGGRESN
jgi:hypothetical protein